MNAVITTGISDLWRRILRAKRDRAIAATAGKRAMVDGLTILINKMVR